MTLHLLGAFFTDEKEAQVMRHLDSAQALEQLRLKSVLLTEGPAHVEKTSIRAVLQSTDTLFFNSYLLINSLKTST